MAIISVNRCNKASREFFERVVGRGGFIPFKPRQTPEGPTVSEEPNKESSEEKV
jgi:hypothetical protein